MLFRELYEGRLVDIELLVLLDELLVRPSLYTFFRLHRNSLACFDQLTLPHS
jgi:hypothetical protein